jgi:fibronectin type 3 domain-containing protein
VVFTPAAASTYSGTLAIQSNASNATLSIGVSGTGLGAAVQHSVSLSWSETSSTAVGYNVYRSAQSGTAYTKLTASTISTTAYADTNVTAGATYYYVLTAVDGSGNESAYSAQVGATVPTT